MKFKSFWLFHTQTVRKFIILHFKKFAKYCNFIIRRVNTAKHAYYVIKSEAHETIFHLSAIDTPLSSTGKPE